MALVERLQRKFGGKVEGITFTREIKETMSVNVRHRFEERLDRIPDNAPEVERDLAAIKRLATPSGNLRFDADRNDHSHADIYWAKALADLAADQPTSHLSDGCIVGTPRQREMQLMRLAGKVF
jgi:phage FluMu gp28-like protein